MFGSVLPFLCFTLLTLINLLNMSQTDAQVCVGKMTFMVPLCSFEIFHDMLRDIWTVSMSQTKISALNCISDLSCYSQVVLCQTSDS